MDGWMDWLICLLTWLPFFRNTAANNGVKKMLSQGDQQSAEFLPSLATGKRFFYGESYSGCVNESPIAEVEKIGDLELPVNILLLYLRFHVLFHNYIAAKGVSGLWTYAYGPFSGTVLHLEDGFLPSINMNLGPGWKMWYFVPRSHFKEMQTLYARKFNREKAGIFFGKFFTKLLKSFSLNKEFQSNSRSKYAIIPLRN